MITRVFRGKSPYGLVRYLYGEGRRNEHTDPHLVASWDGDPAALEPATLSGGRGHHVTPLVTQLEHPVHACRRVPDQWVYHLVIRNDESDRLLTDEEWGEVAADMLAEVGVAPAGDLAGCRWVAVRHADDHLHVVATLAREDGCPARLVRDARGMPIDYPTLRRAAHRWEDQLGLRSTAGRDDATAATRPGVKETVAAERAGRRVSPRVELRHRVQAAAAGSDGFGQFQQRLADAGVTVWPRMSERNPDQITGYSVSLDDYRNAAGEPVQFGGGKLAPDLSWPKLQARWVGASEPAPEAASPSSAIARASSPTLTDAEREQLWAATEKIVHDAAERISADAAGDPDAAADSAWAAGDTLAAAATALEGERGGPISDAAAAFDRAGRERFRRIPRRTDHGHALRTAGRTIAALSAGSRHPGAHTAALAIALAALVQAVADLREAQQRLHQAQAARAAATRLARVAPPTRGDATGPTAGRPPTAASLARDAWGRRPSGRVTPATPQTHRGGGPNDPHTRRGPRQGPHPGRGR